MDESRGRNRKPSPAPEPTPKPAPKTPISEITPEQQIIGAVFLGKVKNYYSHLRVFALTIEAPLSIGDTIRIKGHTTDLTQKVEAMQVEHLSVQSAAPGEAVAVQVADKVRVGDAVYKI
ncbi:MAG: translation elongation factor-like protein [Elusimicrobia bacterium]|nr:translation elongation factor-like protein [Elusimicrobiota bacterium]